MAVADDVEGAAIMTLLLHDTPWAHRQVPLGFKFFLQQGERAPGYLGRVPAAIGVELAAVSQVAHDAISVIGRQMPRPMEGLARIVLLVPHEGDMGHLGERVGEVVE